MDTRTTTEGNEHRTEEHTQLAAEKSSPYASYPEGYRKLVKDIKMPFMYRLMSKMIMPSFVKILIDG